MEILDLLEEIEELINTASTIPFSNRIVLDKDDIEEVLRKINVAIPEEIRRAKWIKEEKDQILIEAKKEAEEIIRAAQEEEARLINHAKFEENRVIEDARNIADNLVSENESLFLLRIIVEILSVMQSVLLKILKMGLTIMQMKC